MRIFLFILIFLLPLSAFADVYVSPQVGVMGPSVVLDASAGTMAETTFGPFPEGARVRIQLDARNSSYKDFKILTCPTSEATKYISKLSARCRTFNFDSVGELTIEAPPNTPMTLILDNTNALITSKTLKVTSHLLINTPEEIQTTMKIGLGQTLEYMRHYISSEPFNISIAPCGLPNAFSVTDGGDITLCTELIFDSSEKGLNHAVLGIFAHELGHTYPNLWGSPHFANEKAADEFAVALLFITENFPPLEDMEIAEGEEATPEKVVNDLIGYFESISNIGQEAQAAVLGSQHPLTAQRINSLQKILSSPQYFVQRWVAEIYPHLTVPALKSIIDSPHIGADVELAKSLLIKKEKGGVVTENKNTSDSVTPIISGPANQIAVSSQIMKKLEAYAVLNDLENADSAAELILENHFKKS